MYQELCDIPDYKNWKMIDKVDKGWSADSKYYIETYDGIKLILRISDASLYDTKKREFEIIKKFNELPFYMSEAIALGMCNNNQNVYMILSWVEGTDLESAISELTEAEQYELGVEAGKILRAIHSVKVDSIDRPIKDKKEKKMLQLERYEKGNVRMENDEVAIKFIKENIGGINPLSPVYQHGDFHVGNLILTKDKKVGVIDFNRWGCGDRYEEFYKIQSFCVEVSIPFAIGQVDGYFNNDPTEEFWSTLAVYVAHASLYSITWAEKFGEKDVMEMKRRCLRAYGDYDNFKEIIPRWYTENCMRYRK